MLRRSFGYLNTQTEDTEYNQENKYLDLGYQKLKEINMNKIDSYMIRVLIVNCNKLKELPSPDKLPHLRVLDCSNNQIDVLPFYPNVREIHCGYNRIRDLSAYQGSKLKILDVSHNPLINLDIQLPEIFHLFAHNCGLTSIKTKNFPNLTVLDCAENNLSSDGLETFPLIEEINAYSCNLSKFAFQPMIKRLNISKNNLTQFQQYPNLEILEIQENSLIHFPTQPNLEKLIANKNQLNKIENQPKIISADLSFNRLDEIPSFYNAQSISLYENPIKDLYPKQFNLQKIQELQIGFETYEKIYERFDKYIKSVIINPNPPRLEAKLLKLKDFFNAEIRELISDSIIASNFKNHFDMLRRLTFQVFFMKYPEYKSDTEISSGNKIMENEIFRTLFYQLRKLYYRSLLITMYFFDEDPTDSEFN